MKLGTILRASHESIMTSKTLCRGCNQAIRDLTNMGETLPNMAICLVLKSLAQEVLRLLRPTSQASRTTFTRSYDSKHLSVEWLNKNCLKQPSHHKWTTLRRMDIMPLRISTCFHRVKNRTQATSYFHQSLLKRHSCRMG